MASREISLWIDERWYQALSKQLRSMTVEEALEEKLEALIDEQVPDPECARISREIWLESRSKQQL